MCARRTAVRLSAVCLLGILAGFIAGVFAVDVTECDQLCVTQECRGFTRNPDGSLWNCLAVHDPYTGTICVGTCVHCDAGSTQTFCQYLAGHQCTSTLEMVSCGEQMRYPCASVPGVGDPPKCYTCDVLSPGTPGGACFTFTCH